jgi:hypothetical protein
MTLDGKIRLMAGTMVLGSLILGYVHSHYWHLLTAFVGVNLVQSAFTRFCPAEKILIKTGLAKPEVKF